ncbi:histidine kinase [Kitasatospora sp. NPDC058115]|uniref:histidine kinase n=1 Tax=Kitasatospora sp. NPDC058115 TaxID=3346347 RepID=UPI0036D7FED6
MPVESGPGPVPSPSGASSGTGARFRARFRRPVGVVAALVVLLPVVLAHSGQHLAALLLAAQAALTVLVAVVPWPWRRATLAQAAGGVAALSLLLDLGYAGPYRLAAFWLPFEWTALLVLAGRAARRARGRWAGPAGVLTVLAVPAVPLRFTLRTPQGSWTGSAIVVLLSLVPLAVVVGAGLYLRVLDARRERAVARARREQRLEVARGLHDFVAHEITGIVLEAQAGQLPGQEPEETAALLRRLEEAGLRALDSMDAMVGALREPREEGDGADSPGGAAGAANAVDATGVTGAVGATRVYGLADLPELVGRFSGTGPTRARLEAAPEAVGLLGGEAGATAYAAVLEALTNVRRHAPGAAEVVVRVEVRPGAAAVAGRVVAGPDVVVVSVSDDGGGSGVRGLLRRRAGSGGTGLVALAERLAAHGGALEAGPLRPAGWRVGCELPVR